MDLTSCHAACNVACCVAMEQPRPDKVGEGARVAVTRLSPNWRTPTSTRLHRPTLTAMESSVMNHLQVLFKRTHRRLSRPAVIMLALVALALGGVAATGDRALAQTSEPCDIYGANGTSCVAAYSTTRAMYASYDGPLYQVQRASDGATANIGLLTAGGDVNAAEQDSFCAASNCTITEIFDQSPEGNNLTVEGPGTAGRQADVAANAKALPMTIGGHEAYGVDIEPGTGYRDDAAHGTATKGNNKTLTG